MIISRGTTPTFEFVFPEVITNYDAVLISFGQDGKSILDKTDDDLSLISGTTYSLTLSESDINNFTKGIIECQVRVSKNYEVAASLIHQVRLVDVLNDNILGD